MYNRMDFDSRINMRGASVPAARAVNKFATIQFHPNSPNAKAPNSPIKQHNRAMSHVSNVKLDLTL